MKSHVSAERHAFHATFTEYYLTLSTILLTLRRLFFSEKRHTHEVFGKAICLV